MSMVAARCALAVGNGQEGPPPGIRFVLKGVPAGAVMDATNMKVTATGPWTVDWGDGSPVVELASTDVRPPTESNSSHVYASAGDYTVVIRGAVTELIGVTIYKPVLQVQGFSTNNTGYLPYLAEFTVGKDMAGLAWLGCIYYWLGDHSQEEVALRHIDLSGCSGLVLCHYTFVGADVVDLDLPGVVGIKKYATENATSVLSFMQRLETVRLPDLTEIDAGSGIFRSCPKLRSVDLPEIVSWTSAAQLFSDCSSLESISAPKLQTISWNGNQGFSSSAPITRLSFPSLTTLAGTGPFGAYSPSAGVSLQNVVELDLPSLTTVTANYAFGGLFRMTRLNIPRVTTLTAKGAFLNCRSLNNENFGDRLDQLIASMAAGGSLPDYMFYHMWGFSGGINGYGGSGAQRRVVVPEGVTTIGEQCFADFGFTVLDLPTTLTSIGKRALHNILVTSYIVSRATTPPSASTGFQTQFDFTKPLYVPRASISAYQAAGGWSSFTDIRALEDLTT